MTDALFKHFVLAIYPTSRGFAFVLLEGPESPYDWGIKDFIGPKKNVRALRAIEKLLKRFHPDELVIEDASASGSKRSARIRHLYDSIADLATERGVMVHRYSRQHVLATFAQGGARSRAEIADSIARHIPALGLWMPPRRKQWMTVSPRQSLFDATALALVHYQATLRRSTELT